MFWSWNNQIKTLGQSIMVRAFKFDRRAVVQGILLFSKKCIGEKLEINLCFSLSICTSSKVIDFHWVCKSTFSVKRTIEFFGLAHCIVQTANVIHLNFFKGHQAPKNPNILWKLCLYQKISLLLENRR